MALNRSMSRFLLLPILMLGVGLQAHAAVRIKDLARIDGVRENSILGYGLVVGLSGTGDSSRNQATLQSVSNMLREFGLQVPPSGINSRNVAAVLVTAELPGIVRVGDRIDVNVSAIGDARSLTGGTLLMTPLLGGDREIYATAQGPLAVGGYRFEQNGNSRQKNYPTAGTISSGAIAERSVTPDISGNDGAIDLLLHDPDYTTAVRVASTVASNIPGFVAYPIDSGRVRVQLPGSGTAVGAIARLESLAVEPDIKARVVVNERTGTVVSGGNVWISDVTITHGDIKVAITEKYQVSQPRGLFLRGAVEGIQTVVVPDTDVEVFESDVQSVSLERGATIADLVEALRSIRVSSQDVIAILQGIKRSGALHAELIIQ